MHSARRLGLWIHGVARDPRQHLWPPWLQEYAQAIGRLVWLWVVDVVAAIAGLIVIAFRLATPPLWFWIAFWFGVLVILIAVPVVAFNVVRKERDQLRRELRSSRNAAQPDPDKLQHIADRIKALPGQRDLDTGVGRLDTASIGGRLLVAATKAGLFQDDEEILGVIDMSMKGEFTYQLTQETAKYSTTVVPPPSWHAFVNTVTRLQERAGKEHQPFGREKVVEGCRMIGEEIDRELAGA